MKSCNFIAETRRSGEKQEEGFRRALRFSAFSAMRFLAEGLNYVESW